MQLLSKKQLGKIHGLLQIQLVVEQQECPEEARLNAC